MVSIARARPSDKVTDEAFWLRAGDIFGNIEYDVLTGVQAFCCEVIQEKTAL
jgi:hypothetical protein